MDKTAETIDGHNNRDIWWTKQQEAFDGPKISLDIWWTKQQRHLVDKTAETFDGQNSKRQLMDPKYHWTFGGQNSRDI